MDDDPREDADAQDDLPEDGPGPLAAPDEPSPRVEAVYLRPLRRAGPQPPPRQQPDPPDATLVDEISRLVCAMLERHVHESVTAAVRALAPRLVISFPDATGTTGTLQPPQGDAGRAASGGQGRPRRQRRRRPRGRRRHGEDASLAAAADQAAEGDVAPSGEP